MSSDVTEKKSKTRSKALPTIVYTYGCKPPENAEAVMHQMRLANRYRNRLCEIELARRAACNEIVRDDRLSELEQQLAGIDAAIQEIADGRAARNQKLRKKTTLTRDERERMTALREQARPLREEFKARKKERYQSEETQSALSAANEASHAEIREARRVASKEWGLYWGTYLAVEAAAGSFRSGPPPRFRGFRGDGMVVVQIQPRGGERLTAENIAEHGGNGLIRIDPVDRRHAWISIKIGTQDPAKRACQSNPAVYARVRATVHRPLPPGCHITWARLCCRKIGPNSKWSVQLLLANSEGFAKSRGDGNVAIREDVVSRDNGDIRVATWSGSDAAAGELVLPAKIASALDKSSELQGLRDDKCNIAKAGLVAWIKATKEAELVALPDWFTEETKTIHAWKSQRSLAMLAIRWRGERFDGDAGIFDNIEAWRKQDRHLYAWQSHGRAKAMRARTDLYRNFARTLAKRYGSFSWADGDPFDGQRAMRYAAVAGLLEIVKQSGMESDGPREVR